MLGKYPVLIMLVSAIGAVACSTGREEVNTTAEAREAEVAAETAGESRVEMQTQFPSWRVATNPPGNTGPNAEGIVRGGAEATTIHIDLDSGVPMIGWWCQSDSDKFWPLDDFPFNALTYEVIADA